MAEPGKEPAATPPPPPQETPSAVEGPRLETDTPVSASQGTGTVAGDAATLDSAQQPKAESAQQPPPQEAVAVAAVGAPEQATTEADAQPPVSTMPPNIPALPPPAETPAQETAPPAAPTPPPQKQEGGVPERASSVHEEKDAPKAGEMPPPQKDSGSVVRVPSKPEVGKGEGETKPAAAMDGKRPEPGQEQVSTLLPAAETSSQETAAAAASAEDGKQVVAPAAQQPPRKQEGGAPEQAPSVGQEEKNAAPAPAPAPARRRWRLLQAVVGLLFLCPKGVETKPPSTPGETPPPVDSAGKSAAEKGEDEMTPSAQDGKTPASGQEEPKRVAKKKPSRKFSDAAARKVMDDGEASKGRRDETKTQARKATPPQQEGDERPMRKKLQKKIRLVQVLMSWFNKHRSQPQPQTSEKKEPEETVSGPGGEEDGEKKTEEKQPASVPEEGEKTKTQQPASVPEEGEKTKTQQHHRNWAREEVRLEGILEEAFARLVAAEYVKELRGVRQKCLLTFSVFELASEVKKQAMIYWWVAEFNLRHRSDPARAPAPAGGGGGKSDHSPAAPQGKAGAVTNSSRNDDAEGIFSMLSDHGFLVPMKNWCSKVIHGCQVNPLVHWMLKRQARADRFAELDDKGSPADLQVNSKILCLTSGNRPILQQMRMKDEPQAQAKKKDEPQAQTTKKDEWQKSKKITKEPSLQGKGNDVQDQQQPATKEEGSKSMAATDKAPSKNDQDPTQTKDQLAKDHEQTTKDEAQIWSKSMAAVDEAPSQKEENTTQAKDQLTKGPQNIKLSSKPKVDEIPPQLFEGKRVILNVNAHVYPISRSAFLHLAECLVVLQLGRWNNHDDKTYMEVAGLDSLNAIGLLKNLRYLGLRGLSRLTELPKGIESLKKLVILDMRGCQNLVKVEASDNIITRQLHKKRSVITQLKQLTHLDLTECYMLEHIGRGITSLTELQVFKGFVFATGTQGNKACQIQDLKKLKKLQKLTVSITTDANVAEGEMADLKNITSLRKLTITWSEIPSILEGENMKKKRDELVERWTSFQLPKDLMKLDIRCYPKKELKLKGHEKLKKLYLRGGDMQRFSIENKPNSINTLRLRYLKDFTMEWKDILLELQNIEYVEIVVTNKDATREKDKSQVTKDIEGEKVKNVMKIPEFTLDKHGVWTKDQKEEDNKKFLAPNNDAMGNNKASLPSEQTEDPSTQDASAITSGNNDGGKATTNEQPKKNE